MGQPREFIILADICVFAIRNRETDATVAAATARRVQARQAIISRRE